MEATADSARTNGKGRRPRGVYYVPAARIEPVAGVTRGEGTWTWTDRYTGTPEALAASGIVPRELMPGEPGAPISSASLRPEGVPKNSSGWHRTPGHIQIFRNHSGGLRVELTVSVEEQERREAEGEAEREAMRSPASGPDRAGSESAEALTRIVRRLGELVRAHGMAAVEQHLAQLRGARPRRPAPDYLRLVWAAPKSPWP